MKKVFILVGEASGDLHASNLIKEAKAIDPTISWQGWGGDMISYVKSILKHSILMCFYWWIILDLI